MMPPIQQQSYLHNIRPPKQSNVNTFPIPVFSLNCTVQAKSFTMYPRVIHRQVFHLCTPLMCIGKMG